jgi:hypothetical protein
VHQQRAGGQVHGDLDVGAFGEFTAARWRGARARGRPRG